MAVLLEGFDFVKEDIPLKFVVGQTIIIDVQITDDDGVPTDITGRSYTVKIGPIGGSPIATLSFSFVNAVLGIVRFTSGSTTALTPGHYWWEVWENTDNFLWGGPVEIVEKRVV